MAQIDSRIAMGFQPQTQLESPTNALAKIMQLQGMQQESAVRGMQMQDAMDARTSKNKMAELYSSSMGEDGKIDRQRLLQGAAQSGLGAQIPGLQKQFAEADEQQGKVDAQNWKLANDRYGAFKTTLGALSQRQDLTKDLVVQAGQELVAAGIIPASMYQQSLANMPDDPNALRARLRDGITAQMTPEQMFTVFAPKPTEVNSGQQKFFKDTNPNSPTFGQVVGGAPTQMQMTPGEMASNQVARGNLAVSQANLGLSRERLNLDKQQGPAGKPPAGYRWTPDGALEPIPGGPGAQRAAEVGFKQGERNDAKDAKRASISAQIAVVDKALAHPGRATSTGLSGTIDPRNYIPGTDAADFRAVLDQIGGTAFLQAFESLKGGGQITEVEGKKATDAIARLSRAQSDKEFTQSLKDLREVMVKGQSRLGSDATPTGGGSNIDALLEKYK